MSAIYVPWRDNLDGRTEPGYVVFWVTDEDIMLHDGVYNTRAKARAKVQELRRVWGYQGRIYRRRLECVK